MFANLILSVVLAISMIATGFGHRFATPQFSEELVAYIAMGGSPADICGDVEDGRSAHAQTCEACRVVSAAALPARSDLPCHLAREVPLGHGYEATPRLLVVSLDPSRPVRAPPLA